MPTKIKTHLVKALVLPILEYPTVPTISMSKTQISKLQKTQNKALRFATEQRYPYTLNTQQIHVQTNTEPLNIKLYNRTEKIWQNLRNEGNPILMELLERKDTIRRYNRNFPSTLEILDTPPQPQYH